MQFRMITIKKIALIASFSCEKKSIYIYTFFLNIVSIASSFEIINFEQIDASGSSLIPLEFIPLLLHLYHFYYYIHILS